MALGQFVRATFTQQLRVSRRIGVAADLNGVGNKLLWTIANSPILVFGLFGHVTTLIGAGLCVPRLAFTPTGGGAQTFLCAAAASIAADAVNTLYTWTGLLAGLLTPGVGIGHLDLTGAEAGFTSPLTFTPGLIQLTGAVDALAGVVDWYLAYVVCGLNATVTPGP